MNSSVKSNKLSNIVNSEISDIMTSVQFNENKMHDDVQPTNENQLYGGVDVDELERNFYSIYKKAEEYRKVLAGGKEKKQLNPVIRAMLDIAKILKSKDTSLKQKELMKKAKVILDNAASKLNLERANAEVIEMAKKEAGKN
jgi:hypothetical protein